MRRILVPILAAFLAGLLAWILWPQVSRLTGISWPSAKHSSLQPAITPIPVAPAGAASDSEVPSHLADELNSPNTDIHADLRLLNEIFSQYRSGTHSDNPTGSNAEITAALTGKNRVGYAFIPKDNPAINASGELCDRWGNPFFFHQLSATQMEIRSAGPDGKMWTGDDEVMTPGLYKPHL